MVALVCAGCRVRARLSGCIFMNGLAGRLAQQDLVMELAEAALAIAPAEDDPESAVGKKDGLCCRHVHLESARRFDSFEKEVCVSLRRKGMDLNVRLDLVRVESIKI